VSARADNPAVSRNTATKLLIWLWGGMTVASMLTGGPWRELLAVSLIIGSFVAVKYWFLDHPRKNAANAEARRLGLTYSATDPFAVMSHPFALFRRTRRSYGGVDNVMWGAWRGLEVRAFDYEYTVNEDDTRELSCVVAAIPGGWPWLVIQPETLVTTIADHLALADIDFELEAFNRLYEVRCEDRRFAAALVDARMMQWLMSRSPLPGFEIHGRWILAYRDQVQPWEIESVLELVFGFIDHIPKVVPSLYPQAPTHRLEPIAGEMS
jgi:hypothetical protein